MARTYKRDSRGRFAGGGGGSGGGGTRKAKPAGGDGRRGPRGGKVGTRAEQRRAAAAQAARSAEFRGKSTTGRGAKAAYKAAQGAARKAGKGAAVTAKAATPSARKVTRKKTKEEALWQADQLMSKAYKKMVRMNSGPLEVAAKNIRRQQRRVNRIAGAMSRMGILSEYQRLTAPADFIHMTPAGPGIKRPRSRRR